MKAPDAYLERLHMRIDAIQERRASGHWEPILWHLVMRGYGVAHLRLADWNSRDDTYQELGRFSDSHSPLGLLRRAYKAGEPFAADNLAISFFNIGDMAKYRHWLVRSAHAGDVGSNIELKRFECRKPHSLARKRHRIRPYREDGS